MVVSKSFSKKIQILIYLLLCVSAILDFGVVGWKNLVSNTIPTEFFKYAFLSLLIIAIVFNVIIYGMYKKTLKSIIIFSIVYLFYIFIYMLVSKDNSSAFYQFAFTFYLVILFLFLEHSNNNLLNLFKVFSNIIIFLSVISLFFYIFGGIMHIIPYSEVEIYRGIVGNIEYVKSFWGISYIGQVDNLFGIEILKNTGIFLEAPSFSALLWPALFYELFCSNKKNKMRISILVLTCVSTFSVKGILLFILIFAFKFLLSNIKFENNHIYFKNVITLVVLPILTIAIVGSLYMLFNLKIDTESGSTRIEDYEIATNVFLDHMLFGVGFSNYFYLQHFYNGVYYGGNTAGLVSFFALGGIYMGLIYVFGIVIMFINKNKVFSIWSLLILIYMMFSSSMTSVYIYVSLGLGYVLLMKKISEKVTINEGMILSQQ